MLMFTDNDNMAQNVKPKNRKSSRKVLQKNLATESGGHNRSQQKGRTVKKLSLGINKGADYERELGGPLGRGKRDKFNHCTESGEPERLVLYNWLSRKAFLRHFSFIVQSVAK